MAIYLCDNSNGVVVDLDLRRWWGHGGAPKGNESTATGSAVAMQADYGGARKSYLTFSLTSSDYILSVDLE